MESETLEFSKGRALIILIVLILGALYAIPNLFPDVPVVQISGENASTEVTTTTLENIEQRLKAEGIDFKSSDVKDDHGFIVFKNTEDQLKARDYISQNMRGRYIAALNLMPTTPEWLANLGGKPMSLGLDLQGGVHFLLEVNLNKAIEARLEAFREEARLAFQKERWYYTKQEALFDKEEDNWFIYFQFSDESFRDNAVEWMNKEFVNFQIDTKDLKSGQFEVRATLNPVEVKSIADTAISQNLQTLRNRVNELGVAEPVVQRQGQARIVVELPGVQDTAKAKRVIGKTANLEFRLVDMESTGLGRVSANSERFDFKGEEGVEIDLLRRIIVTGDRVLDARPGLDENGRPQVSITLDGQGGKRMQAATINNIGNRMAVLFIEAKSKLVKNDDGSFSRVNTETKEVINSATIQDVLGNRFVITGLDSRAEAAELALLLRAGALAAPMYIIEESTIGPSLGQENIESGQKSALIGLAVVMLFMLVYYKVFGLVANIALSINIILIIAVLSVFSATLTLPGIAGIVLTVGMAVDANVLIFSRIREELKSGLSPVDAIRAGYGRAFITIVDANITTFAVALILFLIGTGPIKGFAVTLSIGILTSVFTAVVVSKVLVSLIYGRRVLTRISI